MNVFEELDKINEEQELYKLKLHETRKSYPGQGPLRKALITILKMIGIAIQNENELVLHHIDWDHKNNTLTNLMLVTKSEHSSYHKRYNKDTPFSVMNSKCAFNVGELLDTYINNHASEIEQSEQEARTIDPNSKESEKELALV